MTAGKLAAVKPSATTNTFLYQAPIDRAASAVLNVVNRASGVVGYRYGLRNYTQNITVDSSSYKFLPGNVISSYVVSLIPGITRDSLANGAPLTTEDQTAKFRYLDVFEETSIIKYDVKIASVGSLGVVSLPTTPWVAGATVTGAKGFTATLLSGISQTNTFVASVPSVSASSTSVYFAAPITSGITPVATVVASDLIALSLLQGATANYEIFSVTSIDTTTTFLGTIVRGQLGTTARKIPAGTVGRCLRPSATTTTLSAGILDTDILISVASTTGLTIGNYLRIGNEIISIQGITGTDITVTRGEFGTTAAAASGGDTVNYLTDEGTRILNYFDSGETLYSGGSGNTVVHSIYSTTTNPFSPQTKFIFDTNSDGIFQDVTSLSLNINRIYRFVQTDASNTDYTLRFQAGGAATEYTVGVTVAGTAGSAGAYTEISISSLTAAQLSILGTYSGAGTGDTLAGLSASIVTSPSYTLAYIYDVEGTLSVGGSFQTTTGNNEIGAVYPAPYGYVHDYTGSVLKWSRGKGSNDFTTVSTAISGSSGATTITVGSSVGLVPGMQVSGTGIATGTRISQILSATSIIIDVASSGAVSSTGTFNHIFYDTPALSQPRSAAKVVSFTSSTTINDEDYLAYDIDSPAKSNTKHTGLVVGPGQSVVVYAATADLSFSLIGFEDVTSDFTPILYDRTTQDID
jgi:hypothetical protein